MISKATRAGDHDISLVLLPELVASTVRHLVPRQAPRTTGRVVRDGRPQSPAKARRTDRSHATQIPHHSRGQHLLCRWGSEEENGLTMAGASAGGRWRLFDQGLLGHALMSGFIQRLATRSWQSTMYLEDLPFHETCTYHSTQPVLHPQDLTHKPGGRGREREREVLSSPSTPS